MHNIPDLRGKKHRQNFKSKMNNIMHERANDDIFDNEDLTK